MLKSIRRVRTRLSKKLSRKGLYSFLEQEVSLFSEHQQILSIGSGGGVGGLLLDHAKHQKFYVTQLDIDKKRNPDIIADICYWKKDNYYDAIVMSEVLEHLHSPNLAIENIFHSLKENGKLIITVPFILPIHEEPYDYYRYTKYGLKFLLRNFKNVCIENRNNWGETIMVLLARTMRNENKSLVNFSIFFVILAYISYPFFWFVAKILPSNFMTTGYTVTAVKST